MWSDFSIREKILLAVMLLFLLGGILWKATPALLSALDRGEPPGQGDFLLPLESSFEPELETEPEMITIHLVGAVSRPGIYHLPAGSRVYELVEAAGGASEDADTMSVNLARPLFDGEQVTIYRVGETAADQASQEGKVNINKASVEELKALPSIGEVRARRIIEHREKHGFYSHITEIMDVSGIGQGIFKQIEDLITVY